METFTLSRKELHRPGLLKAVGAGRITNGQAATALRLSVRQVQRLKGRFQIGGALALRHGSRGRPSPRRLAEAVREQIAHFYMTLLRDVLLEPKRGRRLHPPTLVLSKQPRPRDAAREQIGRTFLLTSDINAPDPLQGSRTTIASGRVAGP